MSTIPSTALAALEAASVADSRIGPSIGAAMSHAAQAQAEADQAHAAAVHAVASTGKTIAGTQSAVAAATATPVESANSVSSDQPAPGTSPAPESS